MTMTVRETTGLVLSPIEVVESATTQSRLLMSIVEQTKCYQNISGKKYLQVEAWETIGAFNQVHAETEWMRPIIVDNATVGYEAKVNLMRQGIGVGSAIMPCYFSENACKGKEGDAKHKASMSAAQTFATSKAYRMNYSYVAILAGYQPTPAEEMTGEEVKGDVVVEHFCKVHNTKFFKTPKMRGYSHPYDGPDGKKLWCNEGQSEPTTASKAPASPDKTPDHATTPAEDIEAAYGEAEKPVSEVQALLTTIRASKPALKKDQDVYRWIEARFKLTQAVVDADPNGAWEKIKEEL